ncbi:MAG: hypothetical protein WC340_01275 [Kiritimatiellia bacterium]
MHIHKRLVYSLSLAALIASHLFAAKPIAIVAGREQYDIPRFTKRVLAPSGYVWEERGKFLDPKEFDQYSLIVWFSGCPEKFTDAQIGDLKSYLESGGRILHTGQGLYLTGLSRDFNSFPWLGATGWNYHGGAQKPANLFLARSHPYLAGVDLSTDYVWLNGHYALTVETNQTLNIIGRGKQSIFCVTPVGRGEIAWFWEGPFRCRNWEQPADGVVLDQILLNILRQAAPLTVVRQLREKVPELSREPATLICWKRDWDYASQSDYVFMPAHPLPGEQAEQVSFNSAMAERDTHFLLCQSAVPQGVKVMLSPLTQAGSEISFSDKIKIFVSDKPPVVPSLISKGKADLPAKLGRFMLTPVKGEFAIHDEHPRVLWLELSTHGLPPGEYQAGLTLTGTQNTLSIPIKVKVYAISMPDTRLSQLRYWGGSIPNREPFLTEMERQNCQQISLSYPDTTKIKVAGTGQTLADALKKNPAIFTTTNFPALDFRGVYDAALMLALSHKLNHIQVYDVRTGRFVAEAGTQLKLEHRKVTTWPEEAQGLYSLYYRSLYHYLQERGFEEVDMLWSDEPSLEYIKKEYTPRAKLHMQGEIGSGSHWTASGFMSPEQVNSFAPYTTDWSMYTIMLPNFLKFIKDGSVKLHPRATVGLTRGGCGYALRNPCNQSRTLSWEMIYYGAPVNFLRTGPIWKEWLYYVDFDLRATSRPDGVEGERLVAYGSSDPNDEGVALLSSSDWEASRDGTDDATLVRILEWYMQHLDPPGWFNFGRKRVLRAIEEDKATWFKMEAETASDTTGFDGLRLVDSEQDREDLRADRGFDGFMVRRKHFNHGDNKYDYEALVPPSTDQIETLKKRVLDHLESLIPYAGSVGGSLTWHDRELVAGGKVKSRLIISMKAGPAVQRAVTDFLEQCRKLSGKGPELRQVRQWQVNAKTVNIVVGQATDELVNDILQSKGWSVDANYPGPGNYVIKRDRADNLLLIAGTDEAGVLLGLRNFAIFLEGRGGWLSAYAAAKANRQRMLGAALD